VTEDFALGTMEARGLGCEDLCRVNPDVIPFSTFMLGRRCPHAQQPGFGGVLTSLSGMTALTGWSGQPPTNPYGAYTDFVVPCFAVPAILAALDYRRRIGRGQHLDMSQLEVSLQFMAALLPDYAVNIRERERMGNRAPAAAPHAAYPCRGDDRWCTNACHTDDEWEALCQVLGHLSWIQEGRFAMPLGHKAHEDELDALLSPLTQGWDTHALLEVLCDARSLDRTI
jgi:benzylsuccinate CoA-transferase BbsF subunit